MPIKQRRIKTCGVTPDQLVLDSLKSGRILVDIKNGHVFSTLGRKPRRIGREITSGYRQIKLAHGTGSTSCLHQILEHRAVMNAATGKAIPAGMQVDHLNSEKNDNRVANLEIVTASENMARRKAPKRLDQPTTEKMIAALKLNEGMNRIARRLGISQKAVWARAQALKEAA